MGRLTSLAVAATALSSTSTTAVAFTVPSSPAARWSWSSPPSFPSFSSSSGKTASPTALASAVAEPEAVPEISPLMAAFAADSLARDLMDKGALVPAIAAFTEAVKHQPAPERYLRLGLALEENGEPRRAIEAYESGAAFTILAPFALAPARAPPSCVQPRTRHAEPP